MKQPSFWKDKSIYNIILYPLSILYTLITFIRNQLTSPYKSDIPVICIGNVTSGGAGKTPTAIAIAKILISMGKKPVFLSKGYGGILRVTTIVAPDFHSARQTGDEPLLLSRVATTIVSKNRISGAKLANEKGFDVIIMDDGLQNPTITKDISLLVIDGTFGVGSGHIIPAGPLRENLRNALDRTKAVIFIGEDKTNLLPSLQNNKVIKATIKPTTDKKIAKRYVAFAGLGNPDKFYDTLTKNNYNVIEKFSFADHYQYEETDIDNLKQSANKQKAKLITTEKDYVRLTKAQQRSIETLPITIEFEDEEAIKNIIKEAIN